MNKQNEIQEEINNIVESNPNHYTKQYKIAKWQEAKLEELGIIDMMPNAPYRAGYIGHSDAKAVIEAAEDSGKTTGGFDANSEGWEHTAKPSKLNQLLNAKTEPTTIQSTHASKIHTRCQKSQYRPYTLAAQLEDAISKDLFEGGDHQNAASTMHFCYSTEDFYGEKHEDGPRWCFAGETIGGLGWETDDFEALNEQDAMEQAVSYLEW